MAETHTWPDPIDRLAAGICPENRPVMYQSWRELLFLHWELPQEEIKERLPKGLELDLFEGRAYVGLVLFTMKGIRPKGLPAVRWLSNFHETNVRTYVHVNGRDPGVYFFSLDAANPVAVVLARSLFHLPYHHAKMRIDQGDGGRIEYASTRLRPGPLPAKSAVRARINDETPAPATVGTLDHFLIERYLLYTTSRGRLIRGQVHHSPYPVQSAEVVDVEESLLAAAGLARPEQAPLIHFARGVDVKIFSTQIVPGT